MKENKLFEFIFWKILFSKDGLYGLPLKDGNLVVHANVDEGTFTGIFKLFSNPGINSKESIPPAYKPVFLWSPGIDSKESISRAYVA